jgi:hypothetical protein
LYYKSKSKRKLKVGTKYCINYSFKQNSGDEKKEKGEWKKEWRRKEKLNIKEKAR